MKVDLGAELQFPREITTTSLRPDIVVWSESAESAKSVILMGLFHKRRAMRLPMSRRR